MSAASPTSAQQPQATLLLEGHLLESLTLAKVLDQLQAMGGQYRLLYLDIGQTPGSLSRAAITVYAAEASQLDALVSALRPYGVQTTTTTSQPVLPDAPTSPVLSNQAHTLLSPVRLQGDLLDHLQLVRAMDAVQQRGGTIGLESLEIGAQKTDPSVAILRVGAATEKQLTDIQQALAQLTRAYVPTAATGGAGWPGATRTTTPRFLMCPPTYFEVAYAINPWMTIEGPPDRNAAQHQWDVLHHTLAKTLGAEIEVMAPQPGLPDLVFTANAAFLFDKKAIVAHYKHPERQGEEPFVDAWFTESGYDVVRVPRGVYFEGAGDALCWQGAHPDDARVFAGYRTRTDILSHNWITKETGLAVLSLELLNPRFYHIDVCLCPLSGGGLLWAPDAFDAYGRTVIEAFVPEAKRIAVELEEAALFACNAVNIDDAVVLNLPAAKRLEDRLAEKGFRALGVDLSEFIKAGGSAKCLTLRL